MATSRMRVPSNGGSTLPGRAPEQQLPAPQMPGPGGGGPIDAGSHLPSMPNTGPMKPPPVQTGPFGDPKGPYGNHGPMQPKPIPTGPAGPMSPNGPGAPQNPGPGQQKIMGDTMGIGSGPTGMPPPLAPLPQPDYTSLLTPASLPPAPNVGGYSGGPSGAGGDNHILQALLQLLGNGG